jgi:hypothetical protein
VICAEGGWGSRTSLAGTAQLLAELLARDQDPASAAPWRRQLKAIAAERIGAPGGSERMAAAILAAVRNGAPGGELPPPVDPGT